MGVHPATLRVLGIQYQFLLSSTQQNKNKSSAFAVLWIRIRIHLAVWDPDPGSGAWKLTEIVKKHCFLSFKKSYVCMFFDLLIKSNFHVKI
jgi:hypothetical protein